MNLTNNHSVLTTEGWVQVSDVTSKHKILHQNLVYGSCDIDLGNVDVSNTNCLIVNNVPFQPVEESQINGQDLPGDDLISG